MWWEYNFSVFLIWPIPYIKFCRDFIIDCLYLGKLCIVLKIWTTVRLHYHFFCNFLTIQMWSVQQEEKYLGFLNATLHRTISIYYICKNGLCHTSIQWHDGTWSLMNMTCSRQSTSFAITIMPIILIIISGFSCTGHWKTGASVPHAGLTIR